jgi:hypothetical protein
VSHIAVTFGVDDGEDDDIVGAVERRGFPVQSPGGGYLILHGTTVGKAPSSVRASAILRAVVEAEILLFVLADAERCVATRISVGQGKICVRLNLEGAPDDDVIAASRAVVALVQERLEGAEISAEISSALMP